MPPVICFVYHNIVTYQYVIGIKIERITFSLLLGYTLDILKSGVSMMIDYKNAIVAKITSKNQVTIPKSIRTDLDIKPHDYIVFYTNDQGNVVIKRVDKKLVFWKRVEELQEKYGSINDEDLIWEEDIEDEDFD